MTYLSQKIGRQFVDVFMIVIAGRAHMTLVKKLHDAETRAMASDA